jgi:hypothetical protein
MVISPVRQAFRHHAGLLQAGLAVLLIGLCVAVQLAHAQANARQGRSDGGPKVQAALLQAGTAGLGQKVAVGESSAQPSFPPEQQAFSRTEASDRAWRLSPEQRAVLRDQVRRVSDSRGGR